MFNPEKTSPAGQSLAIRNFGVRRFIAAFGERYTPPTIAEWADGLRGRGNRIQKNPPTELDASRNRR
jgi:hypothetical protein